MGLLPFQTAMKGFATWVAALVLVLSSGSAARSGARLYAFDADAPGHPPARFSLAAMRQSDPGRWTIKRQARNGYVVHEADAQATGYAMAIAPETFAGDASVGVRLRVGGGAGTGGLLWNYQDDQNYDALVLDLPHGTLAMYRVRAGNRVRVEYEDDLELDPDGWHTVTVTLDGRAVRAAIGGVRVFTEEGRRGEGRQPPGRAGIMATGNSTVAFDDLRITLQEHDPS